MQNNDRKLAWSGVLIAAIVAMEIAWYLFVGPSRGAASCEGTDCHEPFWAKPEFWTAAGTFALALSTVGLWYQTKRLAEGADDQSKKMADMIRATEKYAKAASESAAAAEKALVISDRPWIEITAEVSGPLTFTDDKVVAEINFAITNVGKSPAAYATLYAKLHSDSSDAQSYTQKTTREHYGSALIGYGNILFPNAPQHRIYELEMPRADFIARIKEIDASVQSSEEKDADKTPYTHSFPGVSAMVFYVLPNDPKKRPKYTTLILDIKLKRPDSLSDGELFEIGFDGSIDQFGPDKLVLEQSFLSGESS